MLAGKANRRLGGRLRKSFLVLILMTLPALAESCGTTLSFAFGTYPRSTSFQGVRFDVDVLYFMRDAMHKSKSWWLWVLIPAGTVTYCVDIPFSAIADLIVLPFQPAMKQDDKKETP